MPNPDHAKAPKAPKKPRFGESDVQQVKIVELQGWRLIWPSPKVDTFETAAEALQAVKTRGRRFVDRSGRNRIAVITWKWSTPEGGAAVAALQENGTRLESDEKPDP